MRYWRMMQVMLGLLACSVTTAACAGSSADVHWIDAWSAAPDSRGPAFNVQTVRQIVRTSIGGSEVRIRLSNLEGTGPVTIGPVHVAVHADGSAIRPGSDHALTFNGKSTVTIAKGESGLSDPVVMQVSPLQELAISLYLPTNTGPSTIHTAGMATAYVTKSGDATAATELPGSNTISSRIFLADIEVTGVPSARALVAFGDSITDGFGSTPDTNRRWPDVLASRLQADPARSSIAVVNAGIVGNRILNDGLGPSALARFDREALGKPGEHWIVLLEGINDLGGAAAPQTSTDKVSAQQIIDGMKNLIARAHARGMKIYGATLTPFDGETDYWPATIRATVAVETGREAVNTWIRSSGAFDAVIDFDKLVRDPAHPNRLLPAFDSGDHLHPNDAGYKAIANAIDLGLFAR